MKSGKKKLWVRVGQDILGVLLILGSGMIGWLPGPGGIPLLFGGLGLLAQNHLWARRLLVSIKESGFRITDRIFPRNPVFELFYDTLAIAAVTTAIILLAKYETNLLRYSAILILSISLWIILGNRKRLEKIMLAFKKQS